MHAEQERGVWSGEAANSVPFHPAEFAEAPASITVMIAFAHKAMALAWRSGLENEFDIEIKGEAVADATRLLTCLKQHHPQVLLLDRALLDRLDAVSLRWMHCNPHVRVLLVVEHACHHAVTGVLRHRFHGLLPATSPPAIRLKAVHAVSRGELWLSRWLMAKVISDPSWPLGLACADESVVPASPNAMATLTRRELQVVARLRRGCSNKEIARELGVMEDTVKKHLKSVFAKLGVRRRAQVILKSSLSSRSSPVEGACPRQ
ncbi:DNA-binding NarL/FixJ family response regulator [Lysobacter ruishenii]|uniref:DNA-binding NarL/FixJ family response regulator n=2 Tax=Aerolutibacter ruishenii TaxID=686800 RepID=A0A562M3K1_9GAMM|nr:DNA-binding NarL/FixJ family response regulator [Lysobacter ruishenii]